jgi:hypothetical protein
MLRYFHYLIILIFAESFKDSAWPESYLNEKLNLFVCECVHVCKGNYQ